MVLSLRILKGCLLAGALWAVIFCVQNMEVGIWAGYLYFYGMGWPFFISVCWLLIRAGAIDLRKRRDLFIISLVVFGVLMFTLLHAFWIFISFNTPYKGM